MKPDSAESQCGYADAPRRSAREHACCYYFYSGKGGTRRAGLASEQTAADAHGLEQDGERGCQRGRSLRGPQAALPAVLRPKAALAARRPCSTADAQDLECSSSDSHSKRAILLSHS